MWVPVGDQVPLGNGMGMTIGDPFGTNTLTPDRHTRTHDNPYPTQAVGRCDSNIKFKDMGYFSKLRKRIHTNQFNVSLPKLLLS